MRPVTSRAGAAAVPAQVEEIVNTTHVTDIHTHLYDPAFDDLLLWGIDDLLVYHYLVAEAFRYLDLPYDKFWSLTKVEQADLIWDALFIKHSPISEACRGVLTTLNALGLDVQRRDLPKLRRWFARWKVGNYVRRCMDVAGVRRVYMTNSPFDDQERSVWERGFDRDPRFVAALRIDPVVVAWPEAARQLAGWGYKVTPRLTPATFDGVRRFLADWVERMDAKYCMVSLPADWAFPSRDPGTAVLERAILPFCSAAGLPLAVMPGVKRGVNPELRLAGDGVGRSDLSALQNLCAGFPRNRFLATVLSRENQHELCILARKFRNLHIFGCWWFTNVPGIMEDMTRMRLELVGLSFTPQHSDARVLDQIIYKWHHSRQILAKLLGEKYADLGRTGWQPTRAEIQRDVDGLFGGEFERFCRGAHPALPRM